MEIKINKSGSLVKGINSIKLLLNIIIPIILISFMVFMAHCNIDNGVYNNNTLNTIIVFTSIITVINYVLIGITITENIFKYNIYDIREFKSKKGNMKYILHGKELILIKTIVPYFIFSVIKKRHIYESDFKNIIKGNLKHISETLNDTHDEYWEEVGRKGINVKLSDEMTYFKDDMVEMKRVEKLKKIKKR